MPTFNLRTNIAAHAGGNDFVQFIDQNAVVLSLPREEAVEADDLLEAFRMAAQDEGVAVRINAADFTGSDNRPFNLMARLLDGRVLNVSQTDPNIEVEQLAALFLHPHKSGGSGHGISSL